MTSHSLLTAVVGIFLVGRLAFAGSPLELNYTEAIVAYQQGSFAHALELLEPVLRENPSDLKALELKGLALKDLQRPDEALEVFETLRSASTKLKIPPAQAASYDFQSGMLHLELKNPERARVLLANSVKADFNTIPAKYFLGLIAFNQDRDTESRSHFRYVAQSGSGLLRASAYYYLGVLAKRESGEKEALLFWSEAKKAANALIAEDTGGNPSAALSTASAKALVQKIDNTIRNVEDIATKSDFFANVALLTNYDSNVLLNAIVNIGASGNASVGQVLRYGLGNVFHSGEDEWIPSWRGSLNYFYDSAAHGGQFFVNDWSMTYVRASKRTFHWGARVGATHIFRNDTSQSSTGAMKPQSLGIPIAPFFRKSWGGFRWSSEASATPQQFYTDTLVDSTLAKTGVDWRWRNSFQWSTHSTWFNPSIDLEVGYQATAGTEYRNLNYLIGMNNTVLMGKSSALVLRGSIGYQQYTVRPSGERYDCPITLSAQFDTALSRDLHLVSELSLIDNRSNITDIYRYVRLVAALGLDYRF